MNESDQQLRAEFARAGQEHVFAALDRLTGAPRDALLRQAAGIDLRLLERLVRDMRADRPVTTLELERVEPAPFVALPAGIGGRRKEKRARVTGEELLRAGKVAALVVAGGQGSRLGFEGPKGCFPIGPVSGCSLFAWHFAKVLSARRRFGAAIPLLILTSPANHDATVAYLRDNRWFGLPEQDVLVFPQGMLPAVDAAGRLLLETPERLFLSPDGHGGSLAALARHGILDALQARGVEELFYFQVDNPLVKVLDPVFIGYHRLHEAEMSGKMVQKRDAGEKVGVFARSGRKVGVVEYSDLPAELARQQDPEGRLEYGAGNIAIHLFSLAFVRRLTEGGLKLPYHRARKAIPHVDAAGNVVRPDSPNGVKFETFVFDAMPAARRALIVETSRAEEFSPVKNATGEDSAESAARDLDLLFRSWLVDAGFPADAARARIEISPTFAADRDEFVRRVGADRVLFDSTLYLA